MKKKITVFGVLVLTVLFAFVPKNSTYDRAINNQLSVYNYDVCPDCNGAGNIICITCKGNKSIPGKVECSGCNAKGKKDCTAGCNGSGYIQCTYTNCNNGTVTGSCAVCYGKSAEEIKNCRSCQGTGRASVQCNYCKGKGEICHTYCKCTGQTDCTQCNGEKYFTRDWPCGDCGAVGFKKCRRCSGTGKVN